MAHESIQTEDSSINANRWRVVRSMLDAIDALTRLDGWLGALCLALLTAFMIAGMATRILSRFLTWLPPDLPIAWEYSSYLMAATFTFGAAMTLRSGGHIRVRFILSRLAPPSRRILEILVSSIAFVFCVFFTYALFEFTSNSYEFGEKSIASNTPVWIPQAFVTFGVLLMALQFLARVVRTLAGLTVELPAFEPDEISSAIVSDRNS